ncbi:MAG TPA: NADH-quinone oxidoreductase subunit A [Verrucomicrobiae bacterium]|nr:NADH-quinone oxidoreductase subunit A [Verrucomicrobiae bacterium]
MNGGFGNGWLATGAEAALPFVLHTGVALALVAGLLLAAWWFGAKRPGRDKHLPYESGVIPSGEANHALPVPFYLVAIFFIVFDVEAVFIFAWGVAWDLLGLPGLIHITLFIIILLLGLAWLWKKGGLDWGPSREARTGRSMD